MNFLAHIYLSGNNKKVTIGNFIADGIKAPCPAPIDIKIQYTQNIFFDSNARITAIK